MQPLHTVNPSHRQVQMLEILETNVTYLGKFVVVAVVVLLALRRLLSWPRLIPKGTTRCFACMLS